MPGRRKNREIAQVRLKFAFPTNAAGGNTFYIRKTLNQGDRP